MKRWLVALFTLISTCATAQDITNHALPVGGGPGSVGWREAGPCTASQVLAWVTGGAADPSCVSVSTNTRIAKTADYTAVAGDCGLTFALGGNTKFTLTIGAASGYAATCAFTVINEDTQGSGRGKFLVVNGLAAFILWPGQSTTIVNQNNIWKSDCPCRWKLTTNLTVFLSTTGSDSANDGLISGAGGPFLTMDGVQTFRNRLVDQTGYNLTVSAAAGTYTTTGDNLHCDGTAVGSAGAGGNQFIIIGAGSTTIFNSTTGDVFAAYYSCVINVSSAKFTATAGNAFVADRGGQILLGTGVECGAVGQNCLRSNEHGHILLQGNTIAVSGNPTNAFSLTSLGGIIDFSSGTVSLTANLTYSFFTAIDSLSYQKWTGTTINLNAHTMTGARYFCALNSGVEGTGASATFFPGSSGGITATGCQYQ